MKLCDSDVWPRRFFSHSHQRFTLLVRSLSLCCLHINCLIEANKIYLFIRLLCSIRARLYHLFRPIEFKMRICVGFPIEIIESLVESSFALKAPNVFYCLTMFCELSISFVSSLPMQQLCSHFYLHVKHTHILYFYPEHFVKIRSSWYSRLRENPFQFEWVSTHENTCTATIGRNTMATAWCYVHTTIRRRKRPRVNDKVNCVLSFVQQY